MNYHFFGIFAIAVSVTVFADEHSFGVGGSASVSAFDDNLGEDEALGYEAFINYRATDTFLLQAGYADYTTDIKEDISPYFVRFKAFLPVSKAASLYFGGGGVYDENPYPTLNAGLQYQIKQSWLTDIGYQAIFDLKPGDRNLYTLNIGLIYQFSGIESEVAEDVVQRPVSQMVTIPDPVPESVIELETVPELPEEPQCRIENDLYYVQKGDWLMKIGKKYNMTLAEVLQLNSKYHDKDRNVDLIYPGEEIKFNYYLCE